MTNLSTVALAGVSASDHLQRLFPDHLLRGRSSGQSDGNAPQREPVALAVAVLPANEPVTGNAEISRFALTMNGSHGNASNGNGSHTGIGSLVELDPSDFICFPT